MTVLLLAIWFFVLLLGSALAQGAAAPTVADDPVKLVMGGAESLAKGEYWMGASALVSLLTWALRAGVLKRLGKVGNWFYENPVASLATPLVLSALLGAITEFANGTPFTLANFISVSLKVGAGAIAGFIGVKKVEEAAQAGKLARAGITSQQEALDELAKKVLAAPSAPPAPPRIPPEQP